MNMPAAFATLFQKKFGCPSSQSLLEYLRSGLAADHADRVEIHLADCDFCNAELRLLSRYQNTRDECAFPEMPSHIRRLAERLLHSAIIRFSALPHLEGNRRT